MIWNFRKSYKINHSSDENVFYMKVAHNDETNPGTQPVRPPHTPSIPNTQLSPSGSSVRKHETPGILSRMFSPPSPVSPTTALGHTEHRVLPCYILWCFVCSVFIISSPLFSPVDYETDAAADQFDYGVDDPSLLPEQPGKPPPWSPDIAYSSLYCLH